jgi:hypothetical protein
MEGTPMIKHSLLGLATLLAFTACSQPATTTTNTVTIDNTPAVDFSKLVGTWMGNWRGQDGILAEQVGTLELVVGSDGKATCTLKNAKGGQTSACTGSIVGNPYMANSAFLTAFYKYDGEPQVKSSGVVTYLPKDLSANVNRPFDSIIGTMNNIATPGGTFLGDVGNLYFNIKKS